METPSLPTARPLRLQASPSSSCPSPALLVGRALSPLPGQSFHPTSDSSSAAFIAPSPSSAMTCWPAGYLLFFISLLHPLNWILSFLKYAQASFSILKTPCRPAPLRLPSVSTYPSKPDPPQRSLASSALCSHQPPAPLRLAPRQLPLWRCPRFSLPWARFSWHFHFSSYLTS